jgi:hypothetical protein
MSFRSYDLLRLVKDYGEELTLRKMTSAGTYNPATGSVSGSATTDYSVEGYFYNYETLNVDQIQRGTRKCVISALGLTFEPDEEDLILGNADTVTIVSVTTIFSQGVAVCYICHVRE